MFGLTLVDHLRLTFGHVIYMHRAHTQLALRYARWNRATHGAEALLILSATVCSVMSLATGDWRYALASAITACFAAVVVVLRLVLDFDGTVSAHRACSARLWHVREEYRALLADLQDGHITLDRARERRDGLMSTLQTIYEKAPAADRAAFEAARHAAPAEHETALTNEEIDRFLPESMQKSGKSAA